MTNSALQINKTDTQLTVQFPHGEKIPFIHLLIHWLTLTIAVLSLFSLPVFSQQARKTLAFLFAHANVLFPSLLLFPFHSYGLLVELPGSLLCGT